MSSTNTIEMRTRSRAAPSSGVIRPSERECKYLHATTEQIRELERYSKLIRQPSSRREGADRAVFYELKMALRHRLDRELMPVLKPAKFVLAVTVFDRSMEWGDLAKVITLDQFSSGVVDRDDGQPKLDNEGTRVSSGTGLSKRYARELLKELVADGHLESVAVRGTNARLWFPATRRDLCRRAARPGGGPARVPPAPVVGDHRMIRVPRHGGRPVRFGKRSRLMTVDAAWRTWRDAHVERYGVEPLPWGAKERGQARSLMNKWGKATPEEFHDMLRKAVTDWQTTIDGMKGTRTAPSKPHVGFLLASLFRFWEAWCSLEYNRRRIEGATEVERLQRQAGMSRDQALVEFGRQQGLSEQARGLAVERAVLDAKVKKLEALERRAAPAAPRSARPAPQRVVPQRDYWSEGEDPSG